jgi:hypothetical protein
MTFETNVFVNCPFDDAYRSLLRPILFAITDLGFTTRIALESLDSGTPRFAKITGLIRDSKYAIHDLSRIQAATPGEYYRLNMPFELGLDVGCRLFGSSIHAGKQCLVLEAEPYRYQAGLSDLAGSDIAVHGNDPLKALSAVRDWLNGQARLRAAGSEAIYGRFTDFMAANYDALIARGYAPADIGRLPVPELIDDMKRWIAANPR